MNKLMAVAGVAAAIGAGAAFGSTQAPEGATAATDRGVVRELRAIRSELRKGRAETRKLNTAVGASWSEAGTVRGLLYRLCQRGEERLFECTSEP